MKPCMPPKFRCAVRVVSSRGPCLQCVAHRNLSITTSVAQGVRLHVLQDARGTAGNNSKVPDVRDFKAESALSRFATRCEGARARGRGQRRTAPPYLRASLRHHENMAELSLTVRIWTPAWWILHPVGKAVTCQKCHTRCNLHRFVGDKACHWQKDCARPVQRAAMRNMERSSMVSWVTSTSPAMLTRESLPPENCTHGSIESTYG